MSNTIERRISDVNDSITVRLDDLETSLPTIPSKALAASRASVRRVNDIVEDAASSIRGRFANVADDAQTAAKTTSGQARAAAGRVTRTAETGAAETMGQARSAAKRTTSAARSSVSQTTGQVAAQADRTADSFTDEVEGALDDAKVATDPGALADMTKADLYKRATKLDIDGRSAMTKAELVSAIQKS